MEMEENILIVGAGIVGLTTCLGLHRMGLRSLVLESSDSLRVTGFALTTWPNAWRALDAVGIGDSIRHQHTRIMGTDFFTLFFNCVAYRSTSISYIYHPFLKHLYIDGAWEVERVGTEFYRTDSSLAKPSFVSLRALSFHNMPIWKEWVCVVGEGGGFPRLEELYIETCPMLTVDLPVHLPLLKKLEIIECEGVLSRSPASDLMCLESLTTSNISLWKQLPLLLHMLSIERTVDSMESVFEEGLLQSNRCLQDLTIMYCSFSRTLGGVCLPITLKSLCMQGVKNVEFLLVAWFKCGHPFLESLDIMEGTCYSILHFLVSNFPRLNFLSFIRVEGLESLSFSITDGDPISLRQLSIYECPNLTSIELTSLNFLKYLIRKCNNLRSLVPKTACFGSLEVDDCPELIFPLQGLPSSLVSLSTAKCDKLTSLMELGLHLLTCLQQLIIMDCPNLLSLTEEGLPTSLTSLTIHSCPQLKDTCKFWKGGHRIPQIVINDQLLK